ncbi:LacI family DNA-binding transcriptional regulator [Pectobacterium peruviense]|uniref:GntR family transcriptional regulator n=1 Tax=Pectobacterium peruviense TaxID=2066479 RepID=A0ABX4S4D5_9GAMM|nr:LacI family DNA-binding transcriptional regulator [Pectobacterium peruviense]KML69170.1 GntR family transcriptional regulator [Pectobacterium peruviense]PKX85397.1 GntR family transcriptional regulator [Pectobacterium peruviense]
MKRDKNASSTPPRAPTLEDVARAAGISPMTVSRALNNPKIVRAETVNKVIEAVRATGYIPNMLAGGLASRRSKLIAVVVPQINNSMFVDTVQAISDELAARGYHMLLCVAGYTNESEAEIVATLLSRRPDGIVLTGIHHTPELKRLLLNAAIPVVEIWDLTPTPLDMLVGFSHESIGNTIGQYLIGKGHSRFGLVWTEDARAGLRKKGIYDVIQQTGNYVREAIAPWPATLALGRQGLSELLADGEAFDAIICSSDTLAQGVIIEATARGLAVPKQLAVMGFGDLDFAAHNTPSITTVKVDRWKIGTDAAAMLAEKIEGKNVPSPVMDIGFSLIERESA